MGDGRRTKGFGARLTVKEGQKGGVPKASEAPAARLALHHLTMNSKVGTDQAVGNTAWHADTGRERLQQGFHVIVCNVRPHLSLRLGAASILPFLRGLVTAARVQPPCLLSLLLLKTVSERGASARISVTSKGVACDTSRNLHLAVLFRLLSQSRVSVRVAGSVTLGSKESERQSILQVSKQSSTLENCVQTPTEATHMHTPRVSNSAPWHVPDRNASMFPKTQALEC